MSIKNDRDNIVLLPTNPSVFACLLCFNLTGGGSTAFDRLQSVRFSPIQVRHHFGDEAI